MLLRSNRKLGSQGKAPPWSLERQQKIGNSSSPGAEATGARDTYTTIDWVVKTEPRLTWVKKPSSLGMGSTFSWLTIRSPARFLWWRSEKNSLMLPTVGEAQWPFWSEFRAFYSLWQIHPLKDIYVLKVSSDVEGGQVDDWSPLWLSFIK